MTFDQVKTAYLSEDFAFVDATEKQVDKLSIWLNENNMYNAAFMRWYDYKEELINM